MSDTAIDTINECIPDLTEDEALSVLYRLQTQFGWTGTVFTRGDAESDWQQSMPLSPGEEPGELPDELWTAIQTTWAWKKGIPEVLTERGWDLVADAVRDALELD